MSNARCIAWQPLPAAYKKGGAQNESAGIYKKCIENTQNLRGKMNKQDKALTDWMKSKGMSLVDPDIEDSILGGAMMIVEPECHAGIEEQKDAGDPFMKKNDETEAGVVGYV